MTTQEVIQPWFDAVAKICLEYHYFFEHCYNMDELRFAIEASQSLRALINICKKQNWKIIQGKQEWITVIECVNAAGAILLPLFIFKT